jgi:hypothetical protein
MALFPENAVDEAALVDCYEYFMERLLDIL